MAFPYLEEIARPLILSIPLTGIFVVGVMVTDSDKSDVRRAIGLAAIQVVFSCLSLAERGSIAWISVACALLATVALILFSTYCVLRYVMRARVITQDQVYAGISLYLMLGFAFGTIFYLIVTLDPLSFSAN